MFEAYKTFPLGMPPTAGSVADPHSLGYVYIVGFDEADVVKIGCARCPATRLLELQVGCPFELKIHALVSIHEGDRFVIEGAAHKLAKDARIRGEWFELSVDEAIAVVIKAARNKKAKFTSPQAAHEKVMAEHTEAIERQRLIDEDDRRATLRRKLGIEETA